MKNLIIKLDKMEKLDHLYNKIINKIDDNIVEDIKNGGFIFDEYTLIFEIGGNRFLKIYVDETCKRFITTFINKKSYSITFEINSKGELDFNKEESTLYQYHLNKGLNDEDIDEIIFDSIRSIYNYYISIKIIIMGFSMLRKGKHYDYDHERNKNINKTNSVNTNTVSQNSEKDIKLFYEPKTCNATGNRHYKDREYVMTDWYRRGHYRHLKSGKTIYVRPHQVKSDDIDKDYIFEG